jgi:16S rRNA processing protein RimM
VDQTSGEETGFITIAKVIKTQGRIGEVAAVLLTDFPERFEERKRLSAVTKSGQRSDLKLENHWFHKGQVVLKFAGIDSITQAETLIGCEIQVPRSERASLEAGSIYVSDLSGCTVYDRGREIGKIKDVRFGTGEAPLLVVVGKEAKGEKEYLIPFAAGYITSMAIENKRLDMDLPEGMLELDAPLTSEEKQEQHKEPRGDEV